MRINSNRKPDQDNSPIKNSDKTQSLVCLVFVVMSLSLSGCGNKGDLYMPEKEDAKKQQSSAGAKQSKP